TADTAMGSIGVKVWVYQGERLPGQPIPEPALESGGRPGGQRRRQEGNRR
ncbi:MAG: 30S ribosomal protein S3, partial [Coriobacteriales bacterium]|nr:30S ribosomal protein S3 [Coriobacteriales bacterium]